jgi:hypothetical protein
MSDFFERVLKEGDVFKKILSKIPGFTGYFDRANRRSADKLLRETIADHYEVLWRRVSDVQVLLVDALRLEYVDDLAAAAIKLRQFIDRIRTAAYGYAGFFDAVKIDSKELEIVYAYDAAMLELEDEIGRSIDNVEASLDTDGLPAAIRDLVQKCQGLVDLFDKRREVMIGGAGSETPAAS